MKQLIFLFPKETIMRLKQKIIQALIYLDINKNKHIQLIYQKKKRKKKKHGIIVASELS